MEVMYDQRSDTFVISFGIGTVEISKEIKPGVIADYDYQGVIVRLEFLDASRTIASPGTANVSFHFSVK